MNAISRSRATSLSFLALFLLVGCGEQKQKPAIEEDAGAAQTGPQKPVLGGKLGEAVAAAESAHAAPASSSAEGPPENGVFGPGLADKTLAPGAPMKIDLMSDGAEPRVALALTPTDDEQRETIAVSLRLSAQGGGLSLEYSLALKAEKPKDEGKADAGKAKTWNVVATVAGVSPPSSVPRDVAEQIGKLKGTQLRFQMASNGVVSGLTYTLAKDADPGLEGAIRGLVDAVAVSTIPLPSKPVGVGGYWMAAERAPSYLGVDVVRYRVIRVEQIDKGKVTLSVDMRQYATRDEADLGGPGKSQKVGMERFESGGKAKVDWSAGAFLPARGETSMHIQLLARVPGAQGQPPQRAGIQTDLSATMAEGKGDKKKK